MNEAQYWGKVVGPALRSVPNSHVARIENAAAVGTPDVHACVWQTDFWLELKSVVWPPKKPGSVLRLPHYTREQRLWIRNRGKAGGRVYLLLRVIYPTTEHMLFNWPEAVKYVGNVPLTELRDASVVCAGPAFPTDPIGFAVRMKPPTE